MNDEHRLNFFSGQGEMRGRMRAFNWDSTPVGAVETWSQSLKSTVKTLLASRYPMVLIWGPHLIQFYNDAYSKLIGDKHPAALGTDIRITLAEAWDTLGPMIDEVMTTGVANWVEAQMLVLERSGYREESYFSLSHAPESDEDGQVVGMFCVCSEVTQQVLGARRLRLLRDLASKAGETQSVETTCRSVAQAITEHPLDVPFALIYLRSVDGKTLTLQSTVRVAFSEHIIPVTFDISVPQNDDIWSLGQAYKGETVLIENIDQHQLLPGGPWNEPTRAALVMPIASSGSAAPLGVMVVGISPNRALDEGYTSFYELLAGQVSVALRNAQAYEEERKRAQKLAELDREKTIFFSNVSHEFRIVSIPCGKQHFKNNELVRESVLNQTNIRSDAFVEEALGWLADNVEDGESVEFNEIQRPRAKVLLADNNADMREYVRKLLSGFIVGEREPHAFKLGMKFDTTGFNLLYYFPF